MTSHQNLRTSAPRPNRRQVLSTLVSSLLAGGLAGDIGTARAADAWPVKTVRIMVPFAPGGGADSSARGLAEILAPQLGQSVIVENRPVAGSTIGVTVAAQSRDGHTLLMGSNSRVINPSLNPSISYNVARDFDVIGMVSAQPLVLVLVVPAASTAKTLAELIVEMKTRPKKMTAGNSGTGTLAHLTAELSSIETGTTLIDVPYKGESALMPDLISGQVSMGFLNLPSVIVHIRSGRLRALAVSSGQPVAELPGVPTFRSLELPTLEVQGWAALLAPRGMAPEALVRLDELLTKALASDIVQKRFAALSVTPCILGRKGASDYLNNEGARWQQVIKARGIKIEN